MSTEESFNRLKKDLESFGDHIIAEYRRATWRMTWACAGIAAVMNILLVVAVVAAAR